MNQINHKPPFRTQMKKAFVVIFLSLFILGTGNLFAQSVSFTATAKTTVRVGENFQLNYKVNAEGKGFNGPNISNFQVLSGPNTSTNSSVQIINGKVTSKADYVFAYILRATSEGTFTIPPAIITVAGKKYTFQQPHH